MSELPDRMSSAEWRQLHGLPPPGADLGAAAGERKSGPISCVDPDFVRGSGNQPEHLRPQRGRMNKTEAAYAIYLDAMRLAGQVKSWRFEAVTLRLADRTRYTPDFLVERPSGRLELHEVKGFWRDDARVKIKVAAELFPMFAFIVVKRKNRQWEALELRAR